MPTSRRAFSLVEVLVVLAVLSTVVALAMPAVQRAREAASRVACANNLRQVGLAFHQYEQVNKVFPPNRLPCGATWAVLIIPYLEQETLYLEWDLDASYYEQTPTARETSVATYFCPSRRGAGTAPRLSVDGDENTANAQIRGALGDYAYNLGTRDVLEDLYLRPSRHDGLVEVPELTDKEPAAARAILEVRDLQMRADGESEPAHRGKANSQLPAPRTRVKRGSTVYVQFVIKVRCDSDGLPAVHAFPYDEVEFPAAEITDGLSNTFLVGEKHVPLGSFGRGGWDSALYNGTSFSSSGRAAGMSFPLARSVRDPGWKFGSYHPNSCHFLFADGSVRALPASIDSIVLGRLAHHNDGYVIPSIE